MSFEDEARQVIVVLVRRHDEIEFAAARLHEIVGAGDDTLLAKGGDRLVRLAADALKHPAINQHLEGGSANTVLHEEEITEQPAVHPDRYRTARRSRNAGPGPGVSDGTRGRR